ncbi:DUF4238 domain-containing protein [Bizionia arctica]|uniref:DUF4238 domain-containing protein n=1 Tax=Bizionia arctica TaxID=1495645 RepID=A0A917GMP6_9FLAO|nr:DUF4238 domain-containing protein [Bizionia arctica]GGG51902.1 hypothetical protein GCM10010976_23810 [Bizionia arctica]
MNKPINHHFVSQVHIKKFFNYKESRIYVYDKIMDNFYYKKTTKSLFSEKNLNTKIDKGLKDFESLENDLNQYFEKDFSTHYITIKKFIKSPNYSKAVNNSLMYFAKYGAIGEIRNPRHKQSVEDTIFKAFTELSKNGTEELKKEILEVFSYKKEIKYINSVQYSKFADKIINLMGDIIFRIEIPLEKEDYFLLPDFCSANVREKINTYFNPDIKEIAYIGLPLSSKIYIHFYYSKIKNIKLKSNIVLIDSAKVFELNKNNFNYCESKVACQSDYYLNKFIKNVVQHCI